MSDLQKGADGLVTAINGAGITYASVPIAAFWSWFPIWKLADLEDLRIAVVPTFRKATMISRQPSWSRRLGFSIGFWKRHEGSPGDAAPLGKLNPLDEVVQSVFNFLQTNVQIACDGFVLTEPMPDNPVAMSDEMLEQIRTFAAVINVEYRKAPP